MTMTREQAVWFADVFGRLVSNVERVVFGKTHVV
jgi:MoxR-like ATPase